MVELLNEKAAESDGDLWASGTVKCDVYNYEWVAVRPAFLDHLECPNCSNSGPLRDDPPLRSISF